MALQLADYYLLGPSGLRISPLTLGTVTIRSGRQGIGRPSPGCIAPTV